MLERNGVSSFGLIPFYVLLCVIHFISKEEGRFTLVNNFFVVLVVKPLSALVCIEPRRIYSSRISNDDSR